MRERDKANGVSRRQFLRGLGVVGAGSALVTDLLAPEESKSQAEAAALLDAPGGETLHRGFLSITLNVNGNNVAVRIEPRTTLLNALRNHAEPPITGPKLACDQGACGACTVLVDGNSAYACMLLAVDMIGKKITTVEGLVGPGGKLSPVQQAFVEQDALMCGFCTPGFEMSVQALLQHTPDPTLDQVKQACAGNVCRCGTYPRVFEAVLVAAKNMKTQ